MARSGQGNAGRCECTRCECPQDLRLKRGKRSRVCWYCDIGQHPGSPAVYPPLLPPDETKPLNSDRSGHPPAVPHSPNSGKATPRRAERSEGRVDDRA